MNLGQLVGFVRTFIRQDLKTSDAPNVGEIIDLLNQANLEAATRLKIPSTLLTVTNQTNGFNLPSDAWHPDPILSVQYQPSTAESVNLPVVSIQYANAVYPNWTQDTSTNDPEVVIYSGGITSQPDITVYPNPGAADYQVLYRVQPTDMRAMSDTPFNGELVGYHMLLAQVVTFWFTGNQVRLQLYERGIALAAGRRRVGPRVARNAAYSMGGRYY